MKEEKKWLKNSKRIDLDIFFVNATLYTKPIHPVEIQIRHICATVSNFLCVSSREIYNNWHVVLSLFFGCCLHLDFVCLRCNMKHDSHEHSAGNKSASCCIILMFYNHWYLVDMYLIKPLSKGKFCKKIALVIINNLQIITWILSSQYFNYFSWNQIFQNKFSTNHWRSNDCRPAVVFVANWIESILSML